MGMIALLIKLGTTAGRSSTARRAWAAAGGRSRAEVRSMIPDSDPAASGPGRHRGDKRITRVGRILRAHGDDDCRKMWTLRVT